jgi:hypothetical protein
MGLFAVVVPGTSLRNSAARSKATVTKVLVVVDCCSSGRGLPNWSVVLWFVTVRELTTSLMVRLNTGNPGGAVWGRTLMPSWRNCSSIERRISAGLISLLPSTLT